MRFTLHREYRSGGSERTRYYAPSMSVALRRLADEMDSDAALTDIKPMGPVALITLREVEPLPPGTCPRCYTSVEPADDDPEARCPECGCKLWYHPKFRRRS